MRGKLFDLLVLLATLASLLPAIALHGGVEAAQSHDYSFTRTADVDGVGTVTVTVSGRLTIIR